MIRISTVIAVICSIFCLRASENPLPADSWMGRILIAEDTNATSAFLPQAGPIRAMIQNGIVAFTSKPDEKSAWLSLVSTNDTVGIKVHSSSGASGTRIPVVEGVIQGLIEAGVPAKQIIVWDRRLTDLRQGGYFVLAERYPGLKIKGALESGYDENVSYETALLGKLVYGDHEFGRSGESVGRRSFVTKLLTTNVTKIINIPPLLNHNVTGVVGALHSLAISSVDNVLRFEADPDRLGGAVPEIYALEPILDHVAITIVDALIAQSQGEERTMLHYSVAQNEIWFSKDPVALDILSLRELARQRKESGAPLLRANMDIFNNAAILDLGTANPAKLRLERLSKK